MFILVVPPYYWQVRRAILEALPENEREALLASDDLSVRLSAFKSRKYPVAAMLLGSDNVQTRGSGT